MAYYGTKDFDRMVAARDSVVFVPAYEVELAARRLRAEAFGNLVRKAVQAVKARVRSVIDPTTAE